MGSRLRGFEYGERGVTVTLTDGTSIDAALLVGSDGIFSTVRRQLDLAGATVVPIVCATKVWTMAGQWGLTLELRHAIVTLSSQECPELV